jgi:hypothetical protein
MPTNKKKRNNNKKAPTPTARTTPSVLNLDELVSSSSSEMTCYHGSTAEKFPLDSDYGKVICDYISSRQKLGDGISTREGGEFEIKFGMDHIELMADLKFGQFVFAFSTTVYLNNNLEENTYAKSTVRQLLYLGITIKYYWIPASLGEKYDKEKYYKYCRDIGDERGIINCLSRETKIFCDCMKPKKSEAKNMEKLDKCYGCKELFAKADLRFCIGCNVVKYCSKECHINSWPSHKSDCRMLSTKPAAKK